jgi:hypothetical protein
MSASSSSIISFSEELDSSRGSDASSRRGTLRGRAIAHLDRMDWTIRVCVVLSLVALVATVVLLGLSMAEYVNPVLPLYTFSGCIGPFIIAKIIDCYQHRLAKKNRIDLDDYYAVRQPIPKKKDNHKTKGSSDA